MDKRRFFYLVTFSVIGTQLRFSEGACPTVPYCNSCTTNPAICDDGQCAQYYGKNATGKCEACSNQYGCRECTTMSKCTACSTPEMAANVNSPGCGDCAAHCDGCPISGPGKCDWCFMRYTRDPSGICLPKPHQFLVQNASMHFYIIASNAEEKSAGVNSCKAYGSTCDLAAFETMAEFADLQAHYLREMAKVPVMKEKCSPGNQMSFWVNAASTKLSNNAQDFKWATNNTSVASSMMHSGKPSASGQCMETNGSETQDFKLSDIPCTGVNRCSLCECTNGDKYFDDGFIGPLG